MQVNNSNVPQQQTNKTISHKRQPIKRRWRYDLFQCFTRPDVCCTATIFCPCDTAILKSNMDGSSCVENLCCMPCTCSCISLRTIARERWEIHGSVIDDCCIGCFCPICSLCQIKNQYLDEYLHRTGVRHQNNNNNDNGPEVQMFPYEPSQERRNEKK